MEVNETRRAIMARLIDYLLPARAELRAYEQATPLPGRQPRTIPAVKGD